MYEIVGYRRAEGTSKKTGKSYAGYFVYLTYDDPQVTGKSTENVFLSDAILNGRQIYNGSLIDLSYNKQGYLIGVDGL